MLSFRFYILLYNFVATSYTNIVDFAHLSIYRVYNDFAIVYFPLHKPTCRSLYVYRYHGNRGFSTPISLYLMTVHDLVILCLGIKVRTWHFPIDLTFILSSSTNTFRVSLSLSVAVRTAATTWCSVCERAIPSSPWPIYDPKIKVGVYCSPMK